MEYEFIDRKGIIQVLHPASSYSIIANKRNSIFKYKRVSKCIKQSQKHATPTIELHLLNSSQFPSTFQSIKQIQKLTASLQLTNTADSSSLYIEQATKRIKKLEKLQPHNTSYLELDERNRSRNVLEWYLEANRIVSGEEIKNKDKAMG